VRRNSNGLKPGRMTLTDGGASEMRRAGCACYGLRFAVRVAAIRPKSQRINAIVVRSPLPIQAKL
jgi:hypothetical protein